MKANRTKKDGVSNVEIYRSKMAGFDFMHKYMDDPEIFNFGSQKFKDFLIHVFTNLRPDFHYLSFLSNEDVDQELGRVSEILHILPCHSFKKNGKMFEDWCESDIHKFWMKLFAVSDVEMNVSYVTEDSFTVETKVSFLRGIGSMQHYMCYDFPVLNAKKLLEINIDDEINTWNDKCTHASCIPKDSSKLETSSALKESKISNCETKLVFNMNSEKLIVDLKNLISTYNKLNFVKDKPNSSCIKLIEDLINLTDDVLKALIMKAAPLLFGFVSGSLVVAYIILHPLHPEDRISLLQGISLISLGFIFFISLFDLCNHVMFHTQKGKKLALKYKLTLYDVMDISNKVVSAVQAVLSSICGTIVCRFSCPRNMLRTSHFMSQAYAWFGASYFLYDVYSMFVIHHLSPKTINRLKQCSVTKGKDDKSQSNKASHFSKVIDFVIHQPLIIIHHLFIGLFGFLVVVHLRKNFGDCVFGFIFLMELSTPFVSFRGILSKLQMKQSYNNTPNCMQNKFADFDFSSVVLVHNNA
ncbi:hypothetical protein RUM43_010075 [Polyplax serrata]|uniref:TLC domain-containing protein n=1 Tax=Polyplax serrata TaxID=468196 RepID=A0AAN8S4M7_POLSC